MKSLLTSKRSKATFGSSLIAIGIGATSKTLSAIHLEAVSKGLKN